MRRRWYVISNTAPEEGGGGLGPRIWARCWTKRGAEKRWALADRLMWPVWTSMIVHESELDEYAEKFGAPA